MQKKYDLIVIGLGHAGAEAAHAAAKMGLSVLALDPNRGYVKMPCGNSVGGIGKGQMIREIDALGGMAGRVADRSTLQFRMLNRSKGPAMWSPRSQNDRVLYAATWQRILAALPNLDFLEEMAAGLIIKRGKVGGVVTKKGEKIESKAVILTAGTFLNGIMHIGRTKTAGGRTGETASYGITQQLHELGFETGRLKTGTSPRVDGRSLDYSKMEAQQGDEVATGFSYLATRFPYGKEQIYCHITRTNPRVHEIIANNLHLSPMQLGTITGKGPRYCPSIEAKVTRFAEKSSHPIFVQPEGWHTPEVYVNGFSTSLPAIEQHQALTNISGFEQVKVFRWGYAIEYDYILPTQLHPTLETRITDNLYLAGQVNGTTGYEEAAAQGIIAGVNAALKVKEQPPFILGRSMAYIGVLIDDLVYKGTEAEPYRMFTSRNEYRISCHQGNADERLTEKAYQIGLASYERYQLMEQKKEKRERLKAELHTKKISPLLVNPYLKACKSKELIKEKISLAQLLKRPEVELASLSTYLSSINYELLGYSKEIATAAEFEIKYAYYLSKEQDMAQQMTKLENYIIPQNTDYTIFKAISYEGREKLQKYQPKTLKEASHISGVSPSDITILLLYLKKPRHKSDE